MIRVLVAEDSVTARELLVAILRADPGIQVVAEAANGRDAVELTKRLRPDLVTMDIRMPVMDGFEATKRIMIEAPTPIVIVSGSVDVREVEISMRALCAGALAVVQKPHGPNSAGFDNGAANLISTVKAMAQVKVVRRWACRPETLSPSSANAMSGSARVVAVAASTGGPAALQQILLDIPPDFPAPILVVQHIAAGFVDGLAAWLNAVTPLRVKVAEDKEALAPRTVYLAGEGRHLGVTNRSAIALSHAPPIGGFRPSATFLFESVAEAFGPASLAVILTGMGTDGVAGLRAIRIKGGRTVAQDEKSSVVFGMPGAAVDSGLADMVLPLQAIGPKLGELAQRAKEV